MKNKEKISQNGRKVIYAAHLKDIAKIEVMQKSTGLLMIGFLMLEQEIYLYPIPFKTQYFTKANMRRNKRREFRNSPRMETKPS